MLEQDALDILTLVSLIHRKLDGTQRAAALLPQAGKFEVTSRKTVR